MFSNAKTLLAIVSCALVAHAQSSTTATAPASQSSIPAGLDTCIVGCLTVAAGSSPCLTYTNLTCACTSATFQAAAAACLQSNCTTTDLATAQALQSSECASLSSTSAPASTAASSSASSAVSSAAASTSPTSSSAAIALSAPLSFGSLVGTLVASAGVLIGAAFVM